MSFDWKVHPGLEHAVLPQVAHSLSPLSMAAFGLVSAGRINCRLSTGSPRDRGSHFTSMPFVACDRLCWQHIQHRPDAGMCRLRYPATGSCESASREYADGQRHAGLDRRGPRLGHLQRAEQQAVRSEMSLAWKAELALGPQSVVLDSLAV